MNTTRTKKLTTVNTTSTENWRLIATTACELPRKPFWYAVSCVRPCPLSSQSCSPRLLAGLKLFRRDPSAMTLHNLVCLLARLRRHPERGCRPSSWPRLSLHWPRNPEEKQWLTAVKLSAGQKAPGVRNESKLKLVLVLPPQRRPLWPRRFNLNANLENVSPCQWLRSDFEKESVRSSRR